MAVKHELLRSSKKSKRRRKTRQSGGLQQLLSSNGSKKKSQQKTSFFSSAQIIFLFGVFILVAMVGLSLMFIRSLLPTNQDFKKVYFSTYKDEYINTITYVNYATESKTISVKVFDTDAIFRNNNDATISGLLAANTSRFVSQFAGLATTSQPQQITTSNAINSYSDFVAYLESASIPDSRPWRKIHNWLFLTALRSLPDERTTFTRYVDRQEWLTSFSKGEAAKLENRNCSLAVVNTTGISGLARQVTDILERNNIFVIRLTDTFTNAEQSHIVVDQQKKCQQQLQQLKNFLGQPDYEHAVDASVTQKYRADAVLLLGREEANLYSQFQGITAEEVPESN